MVYRLRFELGVVLQTQVSYMTPKCFAKMSGYVQKICAIGYVFYLLLVADLVGLHFVYT